MLVVSPMLLSEVVTRREAVEPTKIAWVGFTTRVAAVMLALSLVVG